MTLAEINPMHGESLYDQDGNLVGKWNGERGMFANCYVVRERTCRDLSGCCYGFECSACGYGFDMPQPNYCPNCGCRVVDDA